MQSGETAAYRFLFLLFGGGGGGDNVEQLQEIVVARPEYASIRRLFEK